MSTLAAMTGARGVAGTRRRFKEPKRVAFTPRSAMDFARHLAQLAGPNHPKRLGRRIKDHVKSGEKLLGDVLAQLVRLPGFTPADAKRIQYYNSDCDSVLRSH